jgi:hypothetical protein
MEKATPENMELPTVEGLALFADISKQAIYRYGKRSKVFRNALRKLKMRQREDLIKIGIFGGKEINSNIVSLMLKANHNMIEKNKTDLDLSGKALSPLLVKFIGEEDGNTA